MSGFEDEEDSEFEAALGRALGRMEAPEEFSDGVMRRLAARQKPPEKVWRMAMAAALLVCVAGAGYQGYERHEAAEARAQFAVAMRVTNRSLKAVGRRVKPDQDERRRAAMNGMKCWTRAVMTAMLLIGVAGIAPKPVWAAATTEEPEALQKDELLQGADQFGKTAKSVTEVSLDKRMLAMMDKFITSSEEDHTQLNLAKKMDFVYVRSYEFEKPGQYKAADLETFRKRLSGPEWSHIVKEKTKDEQNDVWVRTAEDGSFTELVVISAEAAELNFVHLKGHMTMEELTQAGAKYGVPQVPESKAKKAGK